MEKDPRNKTLSPDDSRRPSRVFGVPETLPPAVKARIAKGYRWDEVRGDFVCVWGAV
ncbi:hypothetical protein J4573_52900 [Actinomadura barringtoniae]|uniref:Uncharacterized protein n=1 Tax=Actinomadura barringtoniae TaxID=1427535 RepID=A0A939TA80_9ACTN|nr:hypothetical protein [Actinomadura barringtoniae]MBO2455858.1 hypothetical protein [Actinomadura barringtoniae]